MYEKIAIIGGTGDLGFGLALRWARAGVEILIGSRDEQKARDAAQRARDTLNPDPSHPQNILVSGFENAAACAQARLVVLAVFHNVSAEVLNDVSAVPDCDVLICGDDQAAKETLFSYVKLIPGLRPIDAGPLEMARIVESITALLISVNQRHRVKHSGIRITGLEH